jgi:hypothetical protein
MTDVSALERTLHDLSSEAAQQDDEQLWGQVELASQALANALRSKDGPGVFITHCAFDCTQPYFLSVDNHVLLGQTSLPQSIKLLLTTAMKDAPIPAGAKASATLELIRVAANFCIDNSEL